MNPVCLAWSLSSQPPCRVKAAGGTQGAILWKCCQGARRAGARCEGGYGGAARTAFSPGNLEPSAGPPNHLSAPGLPHVGNNSYRGVSRGGSKSWPPANPALAHPLAKGPCLFFSQVKDCRHRLGEEVAGSQDIQLLPASLAGHPPLCLHSWPLRATCNFSIVYRAYLTPKKQMHSSTTA